MIFDRCLEGPGHDIAGLHHRHVGLRCWPGNGMRYSRRNHSERHGNGHHCPGLREVQPRLKGIPDPGRHAEGIIVSRPRRLACRCISTHPHPRHHAAPGASIVGSYASDWSRLHIPGPGLRLLGFGDERLEHLAPERKHLIRHCRIGGIGGRQISHCRIAAAFSDPRLCLSVKYGSKLSLMPQL